MGARTGSAAVLLAALVMSLGAGAPLAGARSAGADRLVLQAPELPGLSPAQASRAGARRDLVRLVGAGAARGARVDAAAYHHGRGAGALSLGVQAYVLHSPGAARRALARWRSVARRDRFRVSSARLADGGAVATRTVKGRTTAIAALRTGSAVAVLRLALSASDPMARRLVLAYAGAEVGRLRRTANPSAWDRVRATVPSTGVASRQTILELFALAHGALPGVRVPAGSRRGPPISSTWFDQRVLTDLWPSLTRAQRRAVSRALWPPPRRGHARVSASMVDGCLATVGGATLDVSATDDARQLRAAERNHMPFATAFFNACAYGVPGGGTVLANTTPWYTNRSDPPKDGNVLYGSFPDDCYVRLYDGWRSLTTTNQRMILGHEMYHCLHQEWGMRKKFFPGSFGAFPGDNPAWTEDGLASWTGNRVAPGTYQPETGAPGYWYKGWLDHYNQLPLFQTSYEPFGFWGLVGQQAGDALWSRILDIWNAAANSPGIFDTGTAGERGQVLDHWGPGLFSQPSWPGGWQQPEPYQVSIPISVDATVTVSGTTQVATQPYSSLKVQLGAASDRLVETFVDGHGSLSDGVKQWQDPHNVWLCLGGNCTCPSGQQATTSIPQHEDTGPIVYAGLAGDQSVTRLTLGGHAVSEYCSKTQKPSGGGGGGCISCGSSNGDPHIQTIDKRFYDFMSAGEFTVAKSKVDDLEVQERQEPVRHSILAGLLSVDTAVAMRVAGTRVGVYGPQGRISVKVNGRPTTPPSGAGLRLPGGGTLASRHGEVHVTWPDGTQVRVWSVGTWGLSFVFAPARARKRTLTGLFGNFDGDPTNDFVTRAGKQIDDASLRTINGRAFDLLYHTFGDSWRIRQADSLFDYARGKSTRSYTKRNYPKRPFSFNRLPASRRRSARTACAGIKDPKRRAACMIDVGATGDRSFAEDARLAEASTSTPQPALGWTRLSADGDNTTEATSLAASGDLVVDAYRRAGNQLEAASFTAAPSGPAGIARAPIVSGWDSVGIPYIGPRPGGGLHVVMQGIHSGNSGDPLNATVFVARNPDGSYGAPVPASTAYYSTPSGHPVVASDGTSPLWPATLGGSLQVWRGSSNATTNDLGPFSPAPAIAPRIVYDRTGRLWLAWYVLGNQTTTGLYMLQLDPVTGGAASGAATQRVPASRAGANNGAPVMACAQICRLVYHAQTPNGGTARSLLSWAPGEAGPTTVTSDPPSPALLGAAAAPDGRLWVAWFDQETGLVTAKLGDATGAGGESVPVRTPTRGATPRTGEAVALADRLVLAGLWSDQAGPSSQWGAVVPAPAG
jgi:hypothetical protein